MPVTGVRRAIPVLVYEDIPAAHDYLVRVFGFGAGRIEHRLFSHIAMNWRGTPLVNLARS